MDPPARKPVQCFVPKKVYTFMMQQEQLRAKASPDKATEALDSNKPATPSVNYIPQPSDDQQSSLGLGRGEKKFPTQACIGEGEPADEVSSVEEYGHRHYPSKSAVSRGKTSKHLSLLVSQQQGRPSDFDSSDSIPAERNWQSSYEGSKRHGGACVDDAEAKRPCDKSHSQKTKERKNISLDHSNLELKDKYEPDNMGTDQGNSIESHARNHQQLEDQHAMDCHSKEPQCNNQSPTRRHSDSRSSSGMSPVSSYKCFDSSLSQTSSTGGAEMLKGEQQMGLHMSDEISSSVDYPQQKVQMPKRGRPTGSGSGRGRIKVEADSGPCGSTHTLSLAERQDCTICGDIAAGFHCGAYVCEACKKFFVRCLKQGVGDKFVCSRNKTCTINRETRTQCQFCRYQKCVSLGMYKPGSGPGGGKFGAEISHIPCKVCESPSSGYHFGAITCEGCKGFFRRTVKERAGVRYVCSRNGSCNITVNTRNVCKFCRYQKCLQAGMTPDGSRIGRQPNAVKHATMLELQRLHGKPDTGLPFEVKHETQSPVSEHRDAVLPDNAQFELIDPSNFPDDLYLAQPEEGKLEGKLKSDRQNESVSTMLPVMSETESRRLYKSDQSHYSRPIEQSKGHFSTSSSSNSSNSSRYYGDAQVLSEPSNPPQSVDKDEGRELVQQYGHADLAEQLRQVTLPQPLVLEERARHIEPKVSIAPTPVLTAAVEEKVRNLQYQQMQSLAKLEALNAQQRELDRQANEEQTKALELKRELNKLAAPKFERSISLQNAVQDVVMQKETQNAKNYAHYQMEAAPQMRKCNIASQLVQKDAAQENMERNVEAQAREQAQSPERALAHEEAAWNMRAWETEAWAQEEAMRQRREHKLEAQAQEETACQLRAQELGAQEEAVRQIRARNIEPHPWESVPQQIREHQLNIETHDEVARQQWELYDRQKRKNHKSTASAPPSTPSVSSTNLHPTSKTKYDVSTLASGSTSIPGPDISLSPPVPPPLPSSLNSEESTQAVVAVTTALPQEPHMSPKAQEEATDLTTSDVSRNARVPVCVDAIRKLPTHLQMITKKVTHASLQLRPILQKSDLCQSIERGTAAEVVWETMMAQFGQCAPSVINFARRIPGFQSFSVPVQITKVQMSMYPIVLAVLSTQFNIDTKTYNYFNMTTDERLIIFETFPAFKVLPEHFIRIGHAIKLKDMDDIEIAFLLAIILMTSYLPGEEKGSSLPENEADLVAALHTYCIEKEGTDTGRDMYILGQLKVMSECNIEHQQVILQLTEDHPGLQIPQLFMETYLAM